MFEEAFQEFRRMEEKVNRLFADMRMRINGELKPGLRTPPIDIREEKDNIVVSIEIPGIEQKDIKLKVHPNKIELKVERKIEKKVQTEKFVHNERKYKAFYRSFPLPKKVLPEKSKHAYKDGVLKIVMPKVK